MSQTSPKASVPRWVSRRNSRSHHHHNTSTTTTATAATTTNLTRQVHSDLSWFRQTVGWMTSYLGSPMAGWECWSAWRRGCALARLARWAPWGRGRHATTSRRASRSSSSSRSSTQGSPRLAGSATPGPRRPTGPAARTRPPRPSPPPWWRPSRPTCPPATERIRASTAGRTLQTTTNSYPSLFRAAKVGHTSSTQWWMLGAGRPRKECFWLAYMQWPTSTVSAARPRWAGNTSMHLNPARSTRKESTSSSWPTWSRTMVGTECGPPAGSGASVCTCDLMIPPLLLLLHHTGALMTIISSSVAEDDWRRRARWGWLLLPS